MDRLRVVYLSSKRAKETVLLDKAPGLDYRELQLHSGSSKRRYGQAVRQLPGLLRTHRPHAALFEAPGMSALPALLLCRTLQIPYIVRLKGDIWQQDIGLDAGSAPRAQRVARYLNRVVALNALQHAAGVLPISQHLARVVQSHTGGTKPCFVAPIAYSDKILQASQNATLPEVTNEAPLVLTVTNFNFWRKVDRLAQLAPAVECMIRDAGARWAVVGGGTFLDRCRGMLPGLAHVFVGQVDFEQLVSYYASAALLLYISDLDGLPNVLLEAGLFRLPVIINHDCPASEFIQDQVTGLHVDIARQDLLQAALTDLLQNHERRKHLGESLRTQVFNDFSAECAGQVLETGVRFVMEQRGRK